jgi:hypothetical protein
MLLKYALFTAAAGIAPVLAAGNVNVYWVGWSIKKNLVDMSRPG